MIGAIPIIFTNRKRHLDGVRDKRRSGYLEMSPSASVVLETFLFLKRDGVECWNP